MRKKFLVKQKYLLILKIKNKMKNLKNQTIFNQTDNETANAFGKVEHYYQENKEVYQELLKAKDEQIALLKEMLDKK